MEALLYILETLGFSIISKSSKMSLILFFRDKNENKLNKIKIKSNTKNNKIK